MKTLQITILLSSCLIFYAPESKAVPPYCVVDGQFSNANTVYRREGRNTCYRGEHYQRLPGDIYPTLTTTDLTLSNNMAVNPSPYSYYRDIIVPAGVEITVPSGTVFRCYRSFLNYGTINVSAAASGGDRSVSGSVYGQVASNPAHPGLSFTIAADGDINASSGSASGGTAIL